MPADVECQDWDDDDDDAVTLMFALYRGGEKLEFVPASSQLLFTPTSVEVVVDSG